MSDTVRKRSRIACVSCQSRKRKCTGDQPCSTCCQFGIDCHYDLLSRKKKDARSFRPQQPIPPIASTTSRNETIPKSHREGTTGDSPDISVHSLEANSGAAFVRRLGLKIDPANAPRLDLFAWNVGARHPTPSLMPPSSMPRAVSVVDIISLDEMKLLAATFFEKVDPCYGFIDRDHLFRQLGRRWLSPSSESVLPYGPISAGRDCRLILDQHMLSETPSSVDIVTGWVLRVAYLRTTAAPDAAWMASCSLMHLIEATGLHLEPSSDTVLGKSAETCHPEIRRRLYAMRAILTEIFNLLPISESLDPNKAQDSLDLESALANVLDLVHPLASHTLAQCNLMLCIYRRLRGLDSVIAGSLLDQVLELARKGLQASRDMIASISPWHQTANVPFQIICTLLAIDNRASLALLGDAMQTLREVALAYDTDVMREAYSTAYLLILLHQRRKEEDTRTLRGVLRANSTASATQAEITEPTIESTHSLADYPGFSWLSDLVIDMPGLQNFDLESFLATDNSWPLPEPGM
ncbi:C6 transcription factor [Aspergillus nomiae NRRL 13137]|uniref:C6 transcription factor n=1 Tax=Aspergillus nomiae NRRL (strain ATCC 15546 / NRRL 13137 / CBS 260.88 / M93) TaxID=1509407 RepID=A0A0L1ISU4_ASPN3|nr:C6 transcription factor [Aspergillus nomiae NRRL 13137]KNG82651.1 C6 transcription factor [Aspergillus nomiae NRRL 13137]